MRKVAAASGGWSATRTETPGAQQSGSQAWPRDTNPAMPHYDWTQLPEERLNPRVTRKAIHMNGLTIARLHVQKGTVVPEHSHMHEQIATVEKGALKFFIVGGEQIVKAGESLAIPSNVPHAVEAMEDTVVVDVFSPCRDDWLRGDDSYLRR